MRYLLFYLIAIYWLPIYSCGQQTTDDKFDEKSYIKARQGPDHEYPYVITYLNKTDTNYKLKEVFFDSVYSQLLSKSFSYKNVPEGPFSVYADGKLFRQGLYKDGQWDGERLTYRNGKLIQKAYFKKGKKTGVWEDYNSKGELEKRTKYDKNGNIVSE